MSAARRIRRAEARDLETLVEFQLAMARESEGTALDADVLRRGVARVLEEPRCGTYWICEQEQRVVGGLLVSAEWSDWRAGWIWWITSVFVAAEARRTGVYRELYARISGLAREAGDVRSLRLYVEKDNAGAKATYEKLGMRPLSYDLYWHDLSKD